MRLIDADELKHSIMGNVPMMPTVRIAIEHRIEDMPTIDAVPVVRCKDCKHWTKALVQCNVFTVNGVAHCTSPDWFCADGERRVSDEAD